MPRDQIDRMFAALANPTRLRMLRLLQAGGLSADEIMSELSLRRTGAARHLQVLRTAGLVTFRGRGDHGRYSLASARGACMPDCWPAWPVASSVSRHPRNPAGNVARCFAMIYASRHLNAPFGPPSGRLPVLVVDGLESDLAEWIGAQSGPGAFLALADEFPPRLAIEKRSGNS